MDYVYLIARCALGGYLAWRGAPRLNPYGRNPALDRAREQRVPVPLFAVPASGLLLVSAGASIITGLFMLAGVAAVVAYLALTSFWMHAWWRTGVAAERMAKRAAFTRNAALVALLLAALLADRVLRLASIA